MEPIEEVTLLYGITKALNEHLDLKKSLYKVMDIFLKNEVFLGDWADNSS